MSTCVTCPHRETGFCAAAFRSPSLETEISAGEQKFLAFSPGKQIIVQGGSLDRVFVICAGWAFRYIQLSDGTRQILKFLMPGDPLSPISIFEEAAHFSVKSLTSVQLYGFSRAAIHETCFSDRELQSEIARSCVSDAQDNARLAVVLGRRSAEEKIAYLFMHLIERIATSQVIRAGRYPFPLRQQHIADAVGLTPVHVNRVLSDFRTRAVLMLSGGTLEIFDYPELERMASL